MENIFEEKKDAPSNILMFTEINKKALGEISGAIVDKVSSGEEDALETYIKAKALEVVVANIIKDTKAEALSEAEKYEKSDAKLLGCEFVVKNGASRYSFDHDGTWVEINNKIEALKAELKEREKKMIDATRYAELVDEETGEVVPAAEIISAGASVLTISIPKG